MFIEKVIIQNFKCFEGKFEISLNNNLNILVGDNEVGKSTIIEAINLTLSGWLNWRYLSTELTESLFNKDIIKNFLEWINQTQTYSLPPKVIIELHCDFWEDSINSEYGWDFNLDKDRKAKGIMFQIYFDEEKTNEYISDVLKSWEELNSMPIEFCEFSWTAFSRKPKVPRTIPICASLIDSSSFRYKNGSDVNASRIIRDCLTNEEETKISQAHRRLKDSFSNDPSVQGVNKKIQQNISDKVVSLQIETSTKMSWESSLIPYIDDIPFQSAWKWEQCLVKTKLSLQDENTKKSNILLIEEPENHLSHSKLNELISYIKRNSDGKQVIISTHSSFVANKVWLINLTLLSSHEISKKRSNFPITQLDDDTQQYFEKLSWYDTLRLILCKKAILVEWDSDELIVQRAYMKLHEGRLPIEDGIDVISVRSLAFKRFLDIAKELGQQVVVVTDNDWDYNKKIIEKYKDYDTCTTIKICADNREDLKTLEPQFVDANKDDLDSLRIILDLDKVKYPDADSISAYMEIKSNKTKWALKIFDTDKDIKFPQYILDAIQ